MSIAPQTFAANIEFIVNILEIKTDKLQAALTKVKFHYIIYTMYVMYNGELSEVKI